MPVPVPVMFTLHGWDPGTQRVQGWLAARLQQTYPLLAGKSGARKAAGLLAAGKVTVILDPAFRSSDRFHDTFVGESAG